MKLNGTLRGLVRDLRVHGRATRVNKDSASYRLGGSIRRYSTLERLILGGLAVYRPDGMGTGFVELTVAGVEFDLEDKANCRRTQAAQSAGGRARERGVVSRE